MNLYNLIVTLKLLGGLLIIFFISGIISHWLRLDRYWENMYKDMSDDEPLRRAND
jgi:hypothetical protein